jgi:phage recombination protein Bet
MANLTINGSAMSWNPEQLDLIKNQIAKGASDAQLAMFSQVCQKTGLDPFSRQIYCIMRGGNPTYQTSIDGFRTIAARSGLYGGSQTEWCGEDGIWRDVWLSTKPPSAAKTTVYRKGSAHPFTGVARYGAYQQGNSMWSKMPEVMIGKVSEALALRKAFPAELSGIYSGDEMEQADNIPSPPPVAYSATATQYQADLKTAFEILAWAPAKKAEWAKSINPAPFSVWSDANWQLALQKAYAEIDQMNSIEKRIDEITHVVTEDIY